MDSLESNAPLGRTEKILLEAGLVESLHLSAARTRMRRLGGTLPGNLVRMGLVAESRLLDSLSRGYELPTAERKRLEAPQADALALLPFDYAYMHRVLPLSVGRENGRVFLEVALADPDTANSLAALPALARMRLRPLLAGERGIAQAIERAYERSGEDLPPLDAAIDAIGSLEEEEEEVDQAEREGRSTAMNELEILDEPGPAEPGAEEAAPMEVEVEIETPPKTPLPPVRQEPGTAETPPPSKELLAVRVLIELLESKGVLTREEFVAALRKMTQEG